MTRGASWGPRGSGGSGPPPMYWKKNKGHITTLWSAHQQHWPHPKWLDTKLINVNRVSWFSRVLRALTSTNVSQVWVQAQYQSGMSLLVPIRAQNCAWHSYKTFLVLQQKVLAAKSRRVQGYFQNSLNFNIYQHGNHNMSSQHFQQFQQITVVNKNFLQGGGGILWLTLF